MLGKFWRLTPVVTPTIAQGTALIFGRSLAPIFDRETIGVHIGTVGDQFKRQREDAARGRPLRLAYSAASAIKRMSL